MTSIFDPDPPSPTSYLHSADNPHLPTHVLAVCLQDSAMQTSGCALRVPEAEPAAGQVGYLLGWPLPAVLKSRDFAPSAQKPALRTRGSPCLHGTGSD